MPLIFTDCTWLRPTSCWKICVYCRDFSGHYYYKSGSIIFIYDIRVSAGKESKVEDVYGKLEKAITENEAALSADVRMNDVSMARIVYGNDCRISWCHF